MAAHANPFFDKAEKSAADAGRADSYLALARFARLHAQTQEIARLVTLLSRTLGAAVALPIAAVGAIAISSDPGSAPSVAWMVLIVVASLSIARTYASAIGQPFELRMLQAFAKDLCAVTLYAGFSWGAGAFLVLSSASPIGGAALFVVSPALLIGVLLRERNAVLLFLAPAATLTSFACVLRPFAAGTMNAALVLIACAIVAGASFVASGRRPDAAALRTADM